MSCLFDSLARYIPDENVDGSVLRNIICNYLSTNPHLLDDISFSELIKDDGNVEDYVRQMRLPHTFGGAIEIRAYTKLYKINVLVKSLPNKKKITFIENTEYCWAILEWSGNHYEACDI